MRQWRGTKEEVSFASICQISQRSSGSSFGPDVTVGLLTCPCNNSTPGNATDPPFSFSMALATELCMTLLEILGDSITMSTMTDSSLEWLWLQIFSWKISTPVEPSIQTWRRSPLNSSKESHHQTTDSPARRFSGLQKGRFISHRLERQQCGTRPSQQQL